MTTIRMHFVSMFYIARDGQHQAPTKYII